MISWREESGWRRCMAALRELVAMCEERKIPLVLFFE